MRTAVLLSFVVSALLSSSVVEATSARAHRRAAVALRANADNAAVAAFGVDVNVDSHKHKTSTSASYSTTSTATHTSTSTSSPLYSSSSDVTAHASSTVPSSTSTTSPTGPTSSSTSIDFSGTKYATVHHMVGNTYTYRLVDWMTDLAQIEVAGFDAVALNSGPDCWQIKSVDLAFQAAARLNTKVKLFWSFDMNVWPQGGDSDAQRIAGLISKYSNHPNMFKMNGKPFVSTFSGDQWASSFGNSMCGGWNTVRSYVPGDFYFVPAFFFPNGQTIAGIRDCVEGLFQWNSAWSLDGTPVSAAKDLDWATQLGANKTYMAGISPTFFTHYPVDGLNKNWVYRSENNYATRWEQATAINAPMVQVITWNDYGESHYIGQRPSSVQLEPSGTSWVDGGNHLPWARITRPFVETYKTGKPEPKVSDLIIWEYRTHPANATASADPIDRPDGAELLQDKVYITAYLSNPAEIRIIAGSKTGSFQAPAGLSTFEQPFAPGSVTVGMWRDGENVGGTLTSERDIVAVPELYDFNPVVEQFWHDPQWESCSA